MGRRLATLRGASVGVRQTVLLTGVLLALAIAAPVGWATRGWLGIAAAAAAAACCWLGTAVAMVLTDLFRDPKSVWIGWMLGTVPRMGLPLVMAVAVKVRGGALFDSGLLYYLLVFYPVVLGLETVMSLPSQAPPTPPKDHD
jgi:hypothetical protein